MHRACAAKTGAAAEFRARQLQSVAQYPEQRRLRRNIHLFSAPLIRSVMSAISPRTLKDKDMDRHRTQLARKKEIRK